MARILPRVLHLAAGAAFLLWNQPAAAFFQSPGGGLTAEQDHRRLLDLLRIEKLLPGHDGDARCFAPTRGAAP